MSAIDLLVVLALLVTLPALVVAVGVFFRGAPSPGPLARRGRALAALALGAWGACLVAAWWTGSGAWQVAGALLGIALCTAILLGRPRTAGA